MDRENALQLLENKIATAASVKNVSRDVKDFSQLSGTLFPHVQITDLGDTELIHKTGGVVTVGIDIDISIITKAEYANNSTALNLADSEIVAKLYESLTLSGTVDLIKINEREAQDTETTYPFVVVSRKIILYYTGNLTGL